MGLSVQVVYNEGHGGRVATFSFRDLGHPHEAHFIWGLMNDAFEYLGRDPLL